jgi:hypothetical protein
LLNNININKKNRFIFIMKLIPETMKSVFLPIASLLMYSASAQLVIDNATFFIGEGAVVTVQGNLTSNVAIQAGGAGATLGKIQLKGSSLQQINTNGNVIPRLEIDNTSNASLTGDVRVGSRLEFTNGKFQLGANNFIIEDATELVGAGTSKFLEATGAGQARRLVGANVANRVIPVGSGTNYTPFQYTTTGSTYGAGAYIGVQATGAVVPTPQRHPRTESYLGTSWKVTKSGITGGNLAGVGTYVNGQITGTEADLRGMYWNGTTWSLAGGAQDAALNTVTANMTANTGELYGMNNFVLASVKTYLQGAYSGSGLMRDVLRNQNGDYTPNAAPNNNLLPLTDPYRTVDYSTQFPHVDNATPETIAASVLNNSQNPGDNIVDWVFVELRTNATPSTVVQTRAALIQRDGDIVDIDGVSNVYFKKVDAGNYNISVKHRNHLGVRTAAGQAINLTQPVALLNLSGSAASNLNSFAATLSGGLFGLYGGNANKNLNTRISGVDGTTSDYEFIKTFVGASAQIIGYSSSDVNMNRNARISGVDATVSDYEFIKSVIGSAAQRAQPAH